MTKPAVSVVFRAYNCREYIGQAIDSILAQTFQDFEIVVVDDGSTDGTEAILKSYAQKDNRIRVIRNEPNQGPVRTMNIGVREAQGEFIAVHDADDLSLPHRLETQVNFLRSQPNITLMGGGAYFIDEEGEVLRVGTTARKVGEAARQFLEGGQSFIHTSCMYRRISIEAVGLYDEFFTSSHDYDMLVRMANTFEVAYYEEPLVKWRKLNTGITGKKKLAQAAFAELARIRAKAKREGRSINLQQEYERLITNNSVQLKRPISDARYYYNIALQLLEQGNNETARKRFLQALKGGAGPDILLRTLIFYTLSFWPNGINSRPVRALRKTL
jgi:glycosyltransferase involved in cell wall biosynthesis